MKILAADIGGTSSRFAFFEAGPGGALALRHTLWLHTRQAAILPDATGGHVAVPSEGGHAEFPLVGPEETALGDFLRAHLQVSAVTATMLVSGAGLANVHWYLAGRRVAPEEAAAQLVAESQALAWGARFYGRVCKLYALHAAAFGGLIVAGGIAARTPALLTHPEFARELRTSPHMADRLAAIPVSLMTNQESGLWGAAQLAAETLRREAPGRGSGRAW